MYSTSVLSHLQDYGLDVEAFSELVQGCPQKVLELSVNCCQVSRRDFTVRQYGEMVHSDITVKGHGELAQRDSTADSTGRWYNEMAWEYGEMVWRYCAVNRYGESVQWDDTLRQHGDPVQTAGTVRQYGDNMVRLYRGQVEFFHCMWFHFCVIYVLHLHVKILWFPWTRFRFESDHLTVHESLR